MSECKMKITMSICAESSTDAIAKLRAEGMGFNAACKKVAEEYNTTTKEGKRAAWQTLKKRCQREEKDALQSGDAVPSKATQKQQVKVLEKPKIPIITPKEQDTVDSLMGTCKNLRAQIKELKDQLFDTAQEAVNIQVENEKLKTQIAQLTGKRPEQQTNQEFVEEFKEKREERIKKMREYHGYNEDGTPV